jgi:hypothetical protein
MNRMMRGLASCVLIAAGTSGAAWAQTDGKPDLSGNDPHWIEDTVSQCGAANPHPERNHLLVGRLRGRIAERRRNADLDAERARHRPR